VVVQVLEARSQIRTVESALVVASQVPSGATAPERTAPKRWGPGVV
jgi:hypothetical protein